MSKEIYLITIKDGGKPKKKAFGYFGVAKETYASMVKRYCDIGYEETTNTFTDDTKYVKNSKLVREGGEVVRMCLENIPFIEKT